MFTYWMIGSATPNIKMFLITLSVWGANTILIIYLYKNLACLFLKQPHCFLVLHNMEAHTTAQFNQFMSQLRETNATLDFYCDFPKIARNVADIEISLNTLNYLIGKENLREAVEALWNRDKRVFDVMDIIIATRKKDDKKYIDNDGSMHSIHSLFSSVDGVMKFIEGTGLDKVFKNK